MGLYVLLQGIVLLSEAIYRPEKAKKPITFELFELQKRQSTKNESTLHQKPKLMAVKWQGK